MARRSGAGARLPRGGGDTDVRLAQADRSFRFMVDSVVDYAIFMLGPDGRIASWNEGARRLKQYEAPEIIGQHVSVFYPQEDREAGKPQRLLDEATRAGHVEDEGWRIRKDGSRFWADVVITALLSPDGQLRGFGKVTRDLTERKQHENALRELADREHRAAAELRAANRSRQNLVAVVAHDLRAPVSVIHGTADTLLRDWDRIDDEARLGLLRMMQSTSGRLSGLVDDVLDVTRMDAGELRYDIADVDVGAIIERAARDLDPGCGRIAVAAPERAVTVRGDERRIWQISSNLLSNALKFSEPSAPVEVIVEGGSDIATVTVTDHGIGISSDDQPRLFQPFSRIEPATPRPNDSGTGLGLYIARSLVTAQGGAIGVRSEAGEGSAFWFTLPVAA